MLADNFVVPMPKMSKHFLMEFVLEDRSHVLSFTICALFGVQSSGNVCHHVQSSGAVQEREG